MLRRRRLVRVHFRGDEATIDGILVSRTRDHYRLALPKVIDADSSQEIRTMALEGDAEIPRERVLFIQLLAKAG